MKLLVTGGLGFIGSNFILKILNEYKDFSIINVDAELFGSNKKNLEHVELLPNYQYVKGNITNRNLMLDLISQCDAVVNFALNYDLLYSLLHTGNLVMIQHVLNFFY